MQNAFTVKQKPPKEMLISLFEILNTTIIHHFNRIYMKTENKYNHSLKILDGNKDLDQMGILQHALKDLVPFESRLVL